LGQSLVVVQLTISNVLLLEERTGHQS